MSTEIIVAIMGAFVVFSVFFFALLLQKFFQNKRFAKSLTYVALLVRLPKVNPKTEPEARQKPIQDLVAPFEQFAVNLLSLRVPVALEVAVAHIGEEITFYCA